MYKGNKLFDTDNLIGRPLPEQEKFESDYRDFLTKMVYFIDNAFTKMEKNRKEKGENEENKNWAANEMNGILWGYIRKEFAEYVTPKYGSFYLNLNDKFECYIKNINKKMLPKYNHSITSRQRCDQLACLDENPIPIVFVGYTTNKKMKVITGYYAICTKNDEIIWRSDLTTLLPIKKETFANTENIVREPKVNVEVKLKKKAQ